MAEQDNRAAGRILAVLFVGVLMGALDIAIAGPALPAIQVAYGVDDRAVAWVFTIYVLCNLVGTPFMAKLADAGGRRAIYIAAVSLFAGGSLLVAVAPAFGLLLAGRAIQGFGAGGIFPVASAVIGDTFPPERRGRMLGLIGAVFGVAFLIGPILGGILLAFSWRWLFAVNLPLAGALILASLRVLPGARPATRKPFDWPGMLVLGMALTSITYGLNGINSRQVLESLRTPTVGPLLLLGLALLPAFVGVERRAADPILRLALFRSRQVLLAAGFAAGAGLGEAAVVFVPEFLKSAFGVSTATASYMLLPLVLTMAVGSPLAGRALDRAGARAVVLAGNILLALGMISLGLFGGGLVAFYADAALGGVALGILLGAPLRYIMLGEAGLGERAAAQGALTLFTSVGQTLGGALVGTVVTSRGGGVTGYESAYLLIGVLALGLAVLALGLKSRAAELAAMRRPAPPEPGLPG